MSAIIFPGQGSQYAKMAMDFNDNYKISSNIFEEIEDSTKLSIRKLISNNDNNILNQTNFTQITIFSASIVIYKTVLDLVGIDKINPQVVMGHSLGEYSALVASNYLSISDAANLIKIRGELMHSAIKPNYSGMAAIIGKDANSIEEIIKNKNLNIEIANDNSPMQVVVSGLKDDINNAKEHFISEGLKKYIILNVSAAFHSKYMTEAQEKLTIEIEKIKFSPSTTPIISNYNAMLNYEIKDIVSSLKNQMANKVKWTDSVKKLENCEVSQIIEIGPGKVLSGLIARITNKFDIINIDKIEDLDKFKS